MAGAATPIPTGGQGPEIMAGQPPLDESPRFMGVFNLPTSLASAGIDMGRSAISSGADIGSKMLSGMDRLIKREYSEKFRKEFADRNQFVSEDGVALTARVLNPEYLSNDEPAIVYSYSLLVPAKQGAEKPTVADIAKHGEETGRAVVAITTDGLAGPMSPEQLVSLIDFWSMPRRRFEVLRQILPEDKKLIATGASMGGMMSHALAATWEEEAGQSGHLLEVTHDIAVASAGHHQYGLLDYPAVAVQLGGEEVIAAGKYIASGNSLKEKIHRAVEIFGTLPAHPQQLGAVVMAGLGILRAPLEDIESRIPHSTRVVDITFDADGVTHPHRRGENWEGSGHPDAIWRDEIGQHLALLTLGRQITIEELEKIPVGMSSAGLKLTAA